MTYVRCSNCDDTYRYSFKIDCCPHCGHQPEVEDDE